MACLLRAFQLLGLLRPTFTIALTAISLHPGCQRSSIEPPENNNESMVSPITLSGTGSANAYAFQLELEPATPAVGELFSVLTTVRHAQTQSPVTGATLRVDATMPDHGHGMMTAPEHRELGDGRYRSDGFKFHMPGRWVFQVWTTEPNDDRLELDFNQPPSAPR